MNDELIGSAINSIFSPEGAITNPAHQQQQQAQQYKRPWVSLTEEEIHKCIAYGKGGCEIEQTARNIELKLKGLNYD